MSTNKKLYDFIVDFHEDLALVRNNFEEFRVGFINKAGELVIPMDYYGRVIVDGKERFLHFPFFSEGLATVMNAEGKIGYIDKGNNVVLPFVYDYATAFVNGRASVKCDGVDMLIDKNGNEVE